ncbi:hypothetical protein [Neisseria sicca]|uniref:hypothetical protein n=1 Tax=Neisseria sicca TaxID=490 RepID=UPI0016499513|nr:hypothetical protein [Neisseria sicca]
MSAETPNLPPYGFQTTFLNRERFKQRSSEKALLVFVPLVSVARQQFAGGLRTP